LEVRLGLPGREWEVFLLGDDPAVIEWFAGRAGVATWVTVTTHRENEVAAQLTRLGLGLFPEWKLLMSIGLRDHPDAAAASEYRVERTTSGALDYVRILAAEGTVAARGMAAVVGADAVMHDIHTEPAHRRRGLGSVVMAELARRAVARGATTGLLMATADGAQLYRRLGWSSEAAMLTASGLGAEGTSGLGAAGAEGGDLRPVLAGR
jgi:GNAT superfamily N-acetyltransferase